MKINNRKSNLYAKRGFTLIELLAVIVVLAIVMLIAVQAVLPSLDDARQQAFAIEANGLKQAAQQYYVTESFASGLVIKDSHCVTVATLVDKGHSDLDKSKYKGKVVITKTDSGIFLYKVYLMNDSYMVNGEGVDGNDNVNINATDHVKPADASAFQGLTCD